MPEGQARTKKLHKVSDLTSKSLDFTDQVNILDPGQYSLPTSVLCDREKLKPNQGAMKKLKNDDQNHLER